MRDDLIVQVEVVRKNGFWLRVLDDYFPICSVTEFADGLLARLPMENGAFLALIIDTEKIGVGLYVDELPANVIQGVIKATADGWTEFIEEPADVWTWMRQLGRIPVAL